MIDARSILLFLMAMISGQETLATGQLEKPRLEVFKGRRELLLYDGERVVGSYCVALGTNPLPAKEVEGDGATPEGTYFICEKNPYSNFYLSLGISYPGPQDAERGLKAGLISKEEYDAIVSAAAFRITPPWKTKLGGEVFLHGEGAGPDWTKGCIAVENSDMEELFRLVPLNTPISIFP
jgi:murein L,D-transpeptidase YafK